jgi:hypothetical protein
MWLSKGAPSHEGSVACDMGYEVIHVTAEGMSYRKESKADATIINAEEYMKLVRA